MQALESLNDSQVNDFLSGKSPLNLSVRLGDHMMLIQLQLSTINPTQQPTQSSQTSAAASSSSGSGSSSNSTKPGRSSAGSSSRVRPGHPIPSQQRLQHSSYNTTTTTTTTTSSSLSSTFNTIDPVPSTSKTHIESPIARKSSDLSSSSSSSITTSPYNSSKTRSPTDANIHNDLNSYLMKQDVENLESIVKSLSNILEEEEAAAAAAAAAADVAKQLPNVVCLSDSESYSDAMLEQSPIKSLSNLVCSSISEHPKVAAASAAAAAPSTTISTPLDCSDPISANLTSCLCKRLDSNSNGCESHCSAGSSTVTGSTVSKPEQIVPNFGFPTTFGSGLMKPASPSLSSFMHRTANNPIVKPKSRHSLKRHHSTGSVLAFNESSSSAGSTLLPPADHDHQPAAAELSPTAPPIPNTVDNPTLAEASRNLTQTLRKLSKKVFPRGDGSRRIASGAVIESMKHHGKGIYSGTFSGTLNPALQDKHGRPKRDISTIIHILNDLLSAAPHCARNGAKIYFEPTTQGQSSSTTTSAINVTAQSSAGGMKSLKQVSFQSLFNPFPLIELT